MEKALRSYPQMISGDRLQDIMSKDCRHLVHNANFAVVNISVPLYNEHGFQNICDIVCKHNVNNREFRVYSDIISCRKQYLHILSSIFIVMERK